MLSVPSALSEKLGRRAAGMVDVIVIINQAPLKPWPDVRGTLSSRWQQGQ